MNDSDVDGSDSSEVPAMLMYVVAAAASYDCEPSLCMIMLSTDTDASSYCAM